MRLLHPQPGPLRSTQPTDVRHQLTPGRTVQLPELRFTVVEVETTVAREGELQVLFFESELGVEEIVPESVSLPLDGVKHRREVERIHPAQVVPVQIEDEIGTVPSLVVHFARGGIFVVRR